MRRTLSSLNSALGGEGVTSEGDTLALDPKVVDVDVARFRRLIASDKLADAVDYDMLYRTVREVVEGESFHLLEALAAKLADIILERFGIQRVCVRIAKQNLGWTTGGRAIIEVTRDRGAGGAGAARSSKETA